MTSRNAFYLTVLLFLATATLCSSQTVAAATDYMIEKSSFDDADDLIAVPGLTESLHDIIIGAVDDGVIAEIFYAEGDFVKKGAILFTLEHSLEKLEVERRRLIMEDYSERDYARIRARIVNTIYLSNKELYDKTKSVSKEELSKLELEMVQARENVRGLENGEKGEAIEFEIANAILERKRVRAPISGVITELMISPGESYEAPSPVLRMVSSSICLFVCNIDEQVGKQLKKGDTVTLNIQDGDQYVPRDGKIIFVSPVIDSGSGLLEVKVQFSNNDGSIRPGNSGNMIIK